MAALSVERRLLVARDAADRHIRAHQLHFAVDLAAAAHLGEHVHGNTEQVAELFVPLQGVDVIEHRARGVRAVGDVHSAARQLPEQPRVHGAEEQLAVLRLFSRTLDVVEYPFDFCSAEIGVDTQPRCFCNIVAPPVLLQLFAELRRAAALPYDRVIDGLARRFLPYDRRFALIGDADARDLLGRYAALGDALRQGGILVGVDVHRVLFHPARLRIYLGDLVLRETHHVSRVVKEDASRAGRSLVESKNISFHIVHRLLLDMFILAHGAMEYKNFSEGKTRKKRIKPDVKQRFLYFFT